MTDSAAAVPGSAHGGGPGRDGEEENRLRAGPRPAPDRGQRTALFRYELIVALLQDGLSLAERGQAIAAICAAEHPGPDGAAVTVSPATVRRWTAAWREGGFAALVPAAKDQPGRCPEPVRVPALALKDANPHRTARMIRAILLCAYSGRPGDVPASGPCSGGPPACRRRQPPRPGSRRPQGRPAGSRRARRWTAGPATSCTARPWAAAPSTCTHSSTIIPGT